MVLPQSHCADALFFILRAVLWYNQPVCLQVFSLAIYGVGKTFRWPTSEPGDVAVAWDDAQDFNAVVGFTVKNDVAPYHACSHAFAEMRLQFTDICLDLLNPCQNHSTPDGPI